MLQEAKKSNVPLPTSEKCNIPLLSTLPVAEKFNKFITNRSLNVTFKKK